MRAISHSASIWKTCLQGLWHGKWGCCIAVLRTFGLKTSSQTLTSHRLCLLCVDCAVQWKNLFAFLLLNKANKKLRKESDKETQQVEVSTPKSQYSKFSCLTSSHLWQRFHLTPVLHPTLPGILSTSGNHQMDGLRPWDSSNLQA